MVAFNGCTRRAVQGLKLDAPLPFDSPSMSWVVLILFVIPKEITAQQLCLSWLNYLCAQSSTLLGSLQVNRQQGDEETSNHGFQPSE